MKKRFQSRYWLLCVSFLLALLLFFLASSNETSQSGAEETYSHTLTSVPIEMTYDTDDYYVSDYTHEVEVYLTSDNRVKLDAEINEDTRNFKIVADLTDFSEGTHTVKLTVENLPSGVTATVLPDTTSVTIGPKMTKTFSVKGAVADDQLETGYTIKSITTSLSEVKVTSDETTIGQIDHVEASLPDTEVLSDDYSGIVGLQAVSAEGKILPCTIIPTKTRLTVAVKKLTKTVPVTVTLTGTQSETVSDISYKLSQDEVTICGSQEALDAVDEVVAAIDITDVKKNTSKNITLTVSDVTVEPSSIAVQLTVTKK